MKDFKNKTLYTAVQSGNRVELFIKKITARTTLL